MKTSTAFYLALLFLVLIYLEHRLVTSTFDTLRPSSHRPPLTDLVQNGMIVGDVQDLCDFIIAGHPKTGTTSLLAWFANNPEITMYDREIRVLRESAAELAELMYELPDGEGKKAGYKAPNDIRWPNALTAIKQFWPKTKLIVGVRHPVL